MARFIEISIGLPDIASSSELDVEVEEGTSILILNDRTGSAQRIPWPKWGSVEEDIRCRFDKATRNLIISVPQKPQEPPPHTDGDLYTSDAYHEEDPRQALTRITLNA